MPTNHPVAVLRCDIGEPAGDQPPLSAYEAVIGPGGPLSVLDGWSRATFGYLNLSGSRVIPDVLRIDASELVEGEATRDRDTGTRRYSMSRRKVGDRAVELAEDAGWDMSGFLGVVVIARQGVLRHRGLAVRPYRGGASSLSDGRLMCDLAHDAPLYLMAHEVGHVFDYPESFGLRSRAWDWNDPPFDVTPVYGDPYCVMSAENRFDGGDFGYLAANPLSAQWPAATFASAGPGPALALVHQVHPRALRENDCVRRLAHEEWRAPTPSFRLHPATDPTPGRTKLLVLEGRRRATAPRGLDPEGTVYVEYRRPEGLDQGLTEDPRASATACAAVVVHELRDTVLCVPENEENRDAPACTATSLDGALRGRGRQSAEGLRVHYRARIPVPPPLSRDWRARDDGPVLSVVAVAADRSWVDVAVSTAVERAVYFRPMERREVSRTVAFTGWDEPPGLCRPPGRPVKPGAPASRPGTRPTPDVTRPVVTGRYRYTIDLVEDEVTLRVAVSGFGNDVDGGPRGDSPTLTWTLGGARLVAPAAGGPDLQQAIPVVLPTVRYDLATGEPRPSQPLPVTLSCVARPDGVLLVRSPGANGTFNLPITVEAAHAAGSARNTFTVLFTGHERTRDARAQAALRACLRRILEPSRLVQFESPPWERGPRWVGRVPERLVLHPDRFATADREDLDLATAAFRALRAAGDEAGAKEVAALAARVLGVELPH